MHSRKWYRKGELRFEKINCAACSHQREIKKEQALNGDAEMKIKKSSSLACNKRVQTWGNVFKP